MQFVDVDSDIFRNSRVGRLELAADRRDESFG